jgi:putative endopeptidase
MPVKTKRNNKSSCSTKTRKMTKSEMQVVCKQSANTFNRFEEDFEKSINFNLIKYNNNIEKDLISLFKKPFSPKSITPQDDYYNYVNFQWIETQGDKIKKEDKFYVQVDSFRIAQENVYYELMEMTKEYIKKNSGPRVRTISNVYKSFLNYNQVSVKKNVEIAISEVDEILAKGTIYKMLSHINSNELVSFGSPFVWSMLQDEKNSEQYRCYITAPKLTIYDYMIYVLDFGTPEEQKYKREFKARYLKYLKDMFDACLGKTHGLNVETIWDVEVAMMMTMGETTIKEAPDGYNVVLASESVAKYGFDWQTLATEFGFNPVPKQFNSTSLNYLKSGMKMLNEKWNTPEWKPYWYYIYLRQIIRFSDEWSNIHYDFHGNFIRGNPMPMPRTLQPVFGLAACFNTFLTTEYVKKNRKQDHVDYVSNLAYDLKTVFMRILKRNTWLSPATKKYALMKLEHLDLVIGSPQVLREDPLLDYTDDNAWGNLLKLAKWRHNKFIKLDGQKPIDIPFIDWSNEPFKLVGTQAYVVNAYYTATQNRIYVPLAYMQKPFIDLDERGIEYNLAHIGYTIGHELSHSLDNTGCKYDHKGNLHNWWTDADKKVFNTKVKDVINQYEAFAKYDGIEMDASISAGENLADISGLVICEEYLRDFQVKNDDNVPIKSLSFQGFFVYIAVQARQKIYDKAIKSQLKINPHPMDKYRVNCPLSRLELFRAIYNVKKGDKMYWKSTDTIW